MENVRIGKHILLELEAENEEAARTQVEGACKRLLAKLVREDIRITLPKLMFCCYQP